MNTKNEAMKMVLEALEGADIIDCDMRDAIVVIKKVLAQPEQEPVAWDNCQGEKQCRSWCGNSRCVSHWNYTTPPQRTWVGLSDEEIETLIHRFDGDPHTLLDEVNARLKDKNT